MKLSANLATAFERDLFAAAMLNLAANDNPLRLNNFAYALRELIRHVLVRLAPDDVVLNCQWYENEVQGKKRGVSRRQRVLYAVQGGLSDSFVEQTLCVDIATTHTKLRDAIDRLSKYTHIQPEVFNVEGAEVGEMAREVLSAVTDLFELIAKSRDQLIRAYEEQLDQAVIDAAIYETILEVDEICTHHTIEEVYTDTFEVAAIGTDYVTYVASGTITCELQWGSNGDMARGDGIQMQQAFPFTCTLRSPIEDPSEIESVESSLVVDTTSWHAERMEPDAALD